MRTIYKYPFAVDDDVEIMMPVGAEVLTVQMQNEQPCVWALVDNEAKLRPRRFRVLGTGHPFPDHAEQRFVGTFQMHGGRLVFHLFERVEA